MQVKWNATGEVSELLMPDALRAIRRRLAVRVEVDVAETPPKKPEPEAANADSD